MSPQLNSEGLIRMDGRIKEHAGSVSEAEPIILDSKHHVELLIQFHHERAGYLGRGRVVNDLRMKYWIIRFRSAVKAAWQQCQMCKIRKVKSQTPKIAPLPYIGVQSFIRPFTNTGVDYFGPFQVTMKRRHEKRYGVLFTCLNVRAVHSEIANSIYFYFM